MFKANILSKVTRINHYSFILSFFVIILGAFTRLSDAGLGCPDWPGCYGQLIAPAIATAWIEMVHRYVAGILGCLVLYNMILHLHYRKILNNTWPVTILLTSLVIFQALLGMWTVTLRLYPVIVMAHLLGGMAIISLLWWQKLILAQLTIFNAYRYLSSNNLIKNLCNICIVIIIVQLALGAWTSANYTALVCADFPRCQGSLWPTMDFKAAFAILNIGIFDSPGTPLDNTARVTIQMSHRLGALLCFIFISILAWLLFKNKANTRKLGILLFLVLATQISLGITNVLAALPMPIALLHNAMAAILLLTLIKIKHYYALST